MSRLDIVIFGATGFTGKHAVEGIVRLSKKFPGLTWGIAGRSQDKLDRVLVEVSKKTGEDHSKVKTIIADVKDEKSLREMCSQARVVVNCCGPYRFYGEPVVKAAIESKTHHVDVSGEPQFIESMYVKHHEAAMQAGVYIISACGFDSIPNDMGVVFLENNFGGTLNSVESFLSSSSASGHLMQILKRGIIHYGTWESLVYSLTYRRELKSLRSEMFPDKLPTFKPKLKKKLFNKIHDNWSLPFPGADNSILYRTQRYLYENDKKRPVQFQAYVTQGAIYKSILLLITASILYVMAAWKFTRDLLLKYPRLFSFGMVSHEGPTEEVMNSTHFKFTLVGEGWEAGADVENSLPTKKVVAEVRGVNPGYGATTTSLLLSAITILKQSDKMPPKKGVLTTGVAFRKTDLIKHLNENNFTFKIVDGK